MKCKKLQLKNKMRVLLVESHKSPVVSVQMWVRTGSADELKGEEGISHFIEHLVFKGSESFGVGEIAATVEASGGEINAYTSFDQTVFYVTLSKQFEDTGLKVISEMMGSPRFDPAEIDKEREVVIEEIKRGEDSVHRQGSRLLFSTMYKGHPYSRPVIGYEQNVRDFTPEEIRNYYLARYNPENMFLLVVGDFDSKEMAAKVRSLFASFKVSKLRKSKRPPLKKQTSPKFVVQEGKFKESLSYMSWPIPKATHKDIAGLEVLALILGQGESSRLYQRVRLETSSVLSVGSGLFSVRESGFFSISASLNREKVPGFFKNVGDVFAEFLTHPPTEEEMIKAKTNFFSEQFYSMETVDGLARKFGHFEDLYGDPEYLKQVLKQIKDVTSEDLVALFKKYLKPEVMTSVSLCEEGLGESISKESRKFVTALKKSMKLKPLEKRPKAKNNFKSFQISTSGPGGGRSFEVVKLSSGPTLIHRASFDTPVVSVRMGHLGGARFEEIGFGGSTELLSRVWTSGTAELSEAQLNSKVENLASSLSSFGGRHTVGLSMTTLRPYLQHMSDVLFEVLRSPSFSEGVIQREVEGLKEQVQMRPDHPAQLCMLEFMKLMFDKHPYSRDPMGGLTDLGRLSREDVVQLWDRSLSSENLVISISGALSQGEAVRLIEDRIKGWSKKSQSFIEEPFLGLGESKNHFSHLGKEQTHIVLGYPGINMKDPDRYILNVIQAILAGQGGRLFIELRDKASLAYSVSPLRMEALEGGYFGAYIGCTPNKKDKAIEMMKIEFDKISSQFVSEKELGRAKRYLIGRHDIELQKNSSISSSLLFDQIYGVDPNEIFTFSEKIQEISEKDVLRVAQKIFSRPEVLSIVS